MLVKFSEEAVAKVAARVTRSERVISRSGLVEFDAIMDEIDALSIEPVFVLDPRFEQDARRVGLDRWYQLKFASSVSLEQVAGKFSLLGDVSLVEYDIPVLRIDKGKAVSYDGCRSDARYTSLDLVQRS